MPRNTSTDTDLIAKIRKDMQARLTELQPSVDEYRKVEAALRRLNSKGVGRPKGSRNKTKPVQAVADAA